MTLLNAAADAGECHDLDALTQIPESDQQYMADFCPYGQRGDQLWIRETFFAWGRWEPRFSSKKGRDEWHFVDMTLETGHVYCYAAGGAQPALLAGKRDGSFTPLWWKRPAIFMPRWASRITLEITDVRVELLQDISESDAIAEGCGVLKPFSGHSQNSDVAKENYRMLWENIHGAGSWEANPPVWVIGFSQIDATISKATGVTV